MKKKLQNNTLIIIDMQKGFINQNNFYLIDKINKLIKSYDTIFYTKFTNKKNSLYETKLHWSKLQNTKEQEIVVYITKNSKILNKTGYGLNIKDLKNFTKQRINKIDLCGLELDACVYAIALQFFDIGIYPNILYNYTYTKLPKDEIKSILEKQFYKLDTKK